jgi:XTP/dITP diphosphohydrolase
MSEILIATSNKSKADEYRQLLSSLPVEVVTAKDLGLNPPEETGQSVKENALLKARAYYAASELPTLSDDGAFEIDALDGRPGIYGHRWVNGTEDVTDEEIITHTLKEMKHVPDGKRTARMHIAIVFIDSEGKEHIAEGDINGVITRDVHAYTPGFPYRAVFYVPQFGKMYGELTPSEHTAIGHRQKAFQKLLPIIKASIGKTPGV